MARRSRRTDSPTTAIRPMSKSDEMKSMADSMAHQMATMHPDFQRLKDGMKKQVMGMMGKVSKSRGPSFKKHGYDGSTKGKGMKHG